MANIYSDAETVEALAMNLIPQYHAELATARIKYAFSEKASKKAGRIVPGKVRKLSGVIEHYIEADFIVEVALEVWQDLSGQERIALVDHLLEHATGEEDEKTGEMKWVLRDPDVHEFSTILERHGAWNESLASFIAVANEIGLQDMVSTETTETTQETDSLDS